MEYPGLRPYPSLMCAGSSLFSAEAQFKLEFSTGPPSLLGSATLFQVPTRMENERTKDEATRRRTQTSP